MHMAREQLLATLDSVGADDWGRFVPYGDSHGAETLKDVLAHIAASDRAWALQAQGLLRLEGHGAASADVAEPRALRRRAIERGRKMSVTQLLDEMASRRSLLLALYELLERRHLPLSLPSFGAHNSVRERIWRGYHDRLHAADVKRALRLRWYPQGLTFLPDIAPIAEALSPDATRYVIHSVDPVAWEEPSPLPGWSHRALLAHIATGDWVLQTHLRALIETGEVAEWPDVAAGNAERTSERAQSTHEALMEEFLSMRHETMRLLSRLTREHLAAPINFIWEPAPNEHSVLEYLQFFPAHDASHREQLRGAMKHARALRGR